MVTEPGVTVVLRVTAYRPGTAPLVSLKVTLSKAWKTVVDEPLFQLELKFVSQVLFALASFQVRLAGGEAMLITRVGSWLIVSLEVKVCTP